MSKDSSEDTVKLYIEISSISRLKNYVILNEDVGHGIAQAVSFWLPTATRVRVRAEYMGFVMDKAALGPQMDPTPTIRIKKNGEVISMNICI
jgi:hypothetical protein